MLRMSGFDAQFIYDEAPNEPQHTLKIAVLGPEAAAHYSIDVAREAVRARVAALPPLRWRAVRVPFDLHHPVWVEDRHIDLEHHVRRVGLPAPGGRRELCEVISDIASLPLDPERPLWEAWFLEGYRGGRVVCAVKMSHALADGSAARSLLCEALPDEASDLQSFLQPPLPPSPHVAEAVPGRMHLLADALRDLGRDLTLGLPRLLRAAHQAQRRLRAARTHPVTPLHALRAPRTVFGGPLSRRRSFAFTTVPLSWAKEVKTAFGTTVNDVLLATAAGAARRYLALRGAVPSRPIIATIAASTRTPEEPSLFGNRLTTRQIWLPTHLEDPLARLRFAREQAEEAKRDIAARSGSQPEDWLAALPPPAVKTASKLMRAMVRLTGVSGGLVVSSMTGPSRRLWAGPVAIENFISVGHMKIAAGLNVTVWSYAGQLNFALYACRRAVPDTYRIADLLSESLDELRRAAGAADSSAA